MWINGTTKTTQIGYVNRNNQKNHGTRGKKGTDHNATSYKVECLVIACGHVYGVNGTDVFHRKCPRCQGGNAGIEY